MLRKREISKLGNNNNKTTILLFFRDVLPATLSLLRISLPRLISLDILHMLLHRSIKNSSHS